MNKVQAYQSFWESFGLTAYDENTVPDDAMAVNNGKYITYEMADGEFNSTLALTASLWYKGYSWAEITEKELAISHEISRGGKLVPCDGGAIWIKKGTPWAQRMPDTSSDSIRRIVLNVEVEFLD